MDNTLIGKISGFTLDSRKILEKEASEQLEGLYGWLPDGVFADASSYPAVGSLDEAAAVRKALEEYAFAEEQAGTVPKEARNRLVRETAFTWLNRFVALRMMEERGLLKAALSKLHDSAGYLFWLVEEENAREYELHQSGESPPDAAGEGPRHVAYRRFLLWQCAMLSREIPVLFDTSDLPSRLFPRPVVLREMVGSMNDETLVGAWKKGNEETVGWVYQAFNSEELQAAFAGAREQGRKFVPEDIPAVTQLFTIRWVVQFLIENSLGKLWLDIHPDSALREKLLYLSPSVQSASRPLKPVGEIRFLDPACGSMHFGLVAFDVFSEMYKEELAHAGQPGWPEKASVEKEEDIPSAIVANNIHGIDIDLRAVQLSALTLFLKARGGNPKCFFSDRNLVCANIEEMTGGRLEEFVESAELQNPVYERMLRTLARKLRDSENMGSLLRIEQDLKGLIFQERARAKTTGQKTLGFAEIADEFFEDDETMERFFETLEENVLEKLDIFIRNTGKRDALSRHFVHETTKGLCFLALLRKQYDVVATNPPYLSNRKMNMRLTELLEEGYTECKLDLYAAFIKRCGELLSPSGLMAMLTMHSFMFISSYESLRENLGKESLIEVMAHFGGGLFSVGNPGTLQTTAFVLRKEADEKKRKEREGVFFRLVKGRDGEEKRQSFEEAVAAYRSGEPHRLVFSAKQADFEAVPGRPWVYWMPEKLVQLFSELELIASVAQPRQGMATADNKRFLRKWWEVGESKIGFDISSCEETKEVDERWFPYMKGGGSLPWYGNQEYCVNYQNDGYELKAWADPLYGNSGWSRIIKSTDKYFRPGVTWSDVSSKGFAARLSPGGFIHDVKGMTCFPEREDIPFVLALLNSRFAQFVLAALNPTISNQVGDIARLPVPEERSPVLDALVEECVELVRQESRESETTYEFVAPPGNVNEVAARKRLLSEKEAVIDAEVSRLYGLSDEDLAAIDGELSDNASPVDEEGLPGGEKEEGLPGGEGEEDAAVVAGELSVEEWGRRWISYAVGIALGRFEVGAENGLGRGRFDSSVAEALKENRLAAPDGILLNDPEQPLDLAGRVRSILDLLLGESAAAERINSALGSGSPQSLLRDWFGRFTGQPAASFWKHHFQTYRKRPVYWPLQSPGRKFTVWLFHERLTGDTLYSLRNAVVEPRVRLAERRIEDLKGPAEKERAARQELERTRDLADDLRAFSAGIKSVTDGGYTPRIDDGVLLNAAPLRSLLPSWTETKKAWESLERGEYDWAHQAMDFWPERVKAACRANRSFAVAHGLEHLAPPSPASSDGGKRGRKRKGS